MADLPTQNAVSPLPLAGMMELPEDTLLPTLQRQVQHSQSPLGGFLTRLAGKDPRQDVAALQKHQTDRAVLERTMLEKRMAFFDKANDLIGQFGQMTDEGQRRTQGPLLRAQAEAYLAGSGAKVAPELLTQVFQSPGLAMNLAQYRLGQDEMMDAGRLSAALTGHKDAAATHAALEAHVKSEVEQYKSQYNKLLPQLAAEVRQKHNLPPEQLVPSGLVLSKLRLHLPRKSALADMTIDAIYDPKNENMLTAAGIQAPSTEKALAAKAATPGDAEKDAAEILSKLSPNADTTQLFNSAIAVTGKGYSAAALVALQRMGDPVFTKILGHAQAASDVRSNLKERAKARGVALEKVDVEVNLPFAFSTAYDRGQRLYDRVSGQNISQHNQATQAWALDPRNNVAILAKEQAEQFDSMTTFDAPMAVLRAGIDQLAERPFENFGTGAMLSLMDKAGYANVTTMLEKMAPSMFTLARSVQGAGKISDKDLEIVQKGIYTSFSTKAQAKLALDLLDILRESTRRRLLGQPPIDPREITARAKALFPEQYNLPSGGRKQRGR